jgi:hypothetical protein
MSWLLNEGSRASTAAPQRSMGSSITIEVKCVRKLSGGRGLTSVNTNVPPTYFLAGVLWGYESGDLSSSGSPHRSTAGLDGERTITAGT